MLYVILYVFNCIVIYDSCRISYYNSVVWNVFCNDTSCANHYIVTYFYITYDLSMTGNS